MKTKQAFELKVVEVFRFKDGRTVFVGPVYEPIGYIGPCKCQLVVNGQAIAAFQLEGEMMPDRKHPQGFRSVSTRDSIDWKGLAPTDSDCRLRFVGN